MIKDGVIDFNVIDDCYSAGYNKKGTVEAKKSLFTYFAGKKSIFTSFLIWQFPKGGHTFCQD